MRVLKIIFTRNCEMLHFWGRGCLKLWGIGASTSFLALGPRNLQSGLATTTDAMLAKLIDDVPLTSLKNHDWYVAAIAMIKNFKDTL